eukprot:1138889-Prorocentrum_minimum.AAC.7
MEDPSMLALPSGGTLPSANVLASGKEHLPPPPSEGKPKGDRSSPMRERYPGRDRRDLPGWDRESEWDRRGGRGRRSLTPPRGARGESPGGRGRAYPRSGREGSWERDRERDRRRDHSPMDRRRSRSRGRPYRDGSPPPRGEQWFEGHDGPVALPVGAGPGPSPISELPGGLPIGGPVPIPPGAVLVPVPGAGPMGPFVPMMPGPNGPVPIAGAMPMGGPGGMMASPAVPRGVGEKNASDMDGNDWEEREGKLGGGRSGGKSNGGGRGMHGFVPMSVPPAGHRVDPRSIRQYVDLDAAGDTSIELDYRDL